MICVPYLTPSPIASPARIRLTPDEVARFFSALAEKPFWYGFFKVQWHYGCSESEPALLRVKDVDFRNGQITIRRLKRRNEAGGVKSFLYELENDVADSLRVVRNLVRRSWKVPAVSPWFFPSRRDQEAAASVVRLTEIRRSTDGWRAVSRSAVDRAFGRAARDAGIPEHLCQNRFLRHTRAEMLAAEGVPEEEIQHLLGHADITSTRRYTRPRAA